MRGSPRARTTRHGTSVRVPPATLGPASSAPPTPAARAASSLHLRPAHLIRGARPSPAAFGPRSRPRAPSSERCGRTMETARRTRLPWRRPADGGPQAPSRTESVLRLRAGHLQRSSARSGPQSCPAARPPLPGVGDTEGEVVGRCSHGESRCMRRTSAGWRERAGPEDGLGSLWRIMARVTGRFALQADHGVKA